MADIIKMCFLSSERIRGECLMSNLTEIAFMLSVGLLLFGGLLSYIFHQKPKISIWIGFVSACTAGLSTLAVGLRVLILGQPLCVPVPWSVVGVKWAFVVDPLSAFFLLVISVTVLAVSVFSIGYVTEYIGKHDVGVLGLLFNLFIFSMIALVSSENSMMFLFFWELMSLASFFLVVFDHRNSKVRKAGFIYVVMTHIGTMFIVAAFMILFKEAGSFSFSQYSAIGHQLPVRLKTIIFLLATVGFGTKAGIIPLHIWLPRAHPAAPSNVSALMSGVMLKTAIYGFLKIVLVVLGGGPTWWGVVILILGTVSALLGVMYALMEHDIKRLLAYHSVENIGIILIGIGTMLIFIGSGNQAYAVVALTASLFHVLNHAIFKGLLFLGVGSVHYSTRTRDIEKMGGLLKRMPWTGFFFLIGSISISAMPPFNGFVSEWMTFQSLLMLGIGKTSPAIGVLGPFCAAMLALTGALAAACFVKAFGIQFLALPRSKNAEDATEVPISMRLGMGMLALLCFVIGICPSIIIRLISPVTYAVIGVGTAPLLGGYRWLDVISPNLGTGVAPLSLLVMLTAVMFIIYLVVRVTGKGGTVRIDETWNCGTALTSKMEYTATSFSKPIRIIFRKIFQPRREIEKEYDLEPYFTKNIKYSGSIKPVFEDSMYRPTAKILIYISSKIRALQSGSIHLYLTYIFVTLVALLIFAR